MNLSTALPASPSTADAVARLRQWQQDGRHDAVIANATTLLASLPEDRDLLLLAAASLRLSGRIDESLAMLERLEAAHPRFSLMLQERGLCHVARKQAPEAIDALLRAVNLNPALPMSWKMLEGLYRIVGDADNARTAAGHRAALAALRPEIVTATSLFSDGDLDPAERLIRGVLQQHGDDPEAMRLLAKITIATTRRRGTIMRNASSSGTNMPKRARRPTCCSGPTRRTSTIASSRRPSRSGWVTRRRRSISIAACSPKCPDRPTSICGWAMR